MTDVAKLAALVKEFELHSKTAPTPAVQIAYKQAEYDVEALAYSLPSGDMGPLFTLDTIATACFTIGISDEVFENLSIALSGRST